MYEQLESLSKKKTIILFTFVFLFSSVLYSIAIYLAGVNLAFDELYSIAMTDYSYSEIYNITARDVHPPLFYWLLKLIGGLFTFSHFELYEYRYITGFFYLTSLLVCFFPVRRMFGNTTAFATSLILVLLPAAFYTYNYVRMYSLAVPLLLAVFVYMYDAYRNNSGWAWGKLFIFLLAAMYTHYYALLAAFWGMILFVVLILVTEKGEKRKSEIKRYFILGAALVVSYIPWLIELYKQVTTVKENYWITKPTIAEFLFSLQYYFSPKHFEKKYTDFFSSSWPLFFSFLLLGLTLLIFYVGLRSKEDKEKKTMGLYASCIMWVTIVFIVLYSYLFSPVFFVRYLSTYIGLFSVSCAIFITAIIKEKKKSGNLLVAAFFSVLIFLSCICYYLNGIRRINSPKGNKVYTEKLEKFMRGTNGIIYTEEILSPNLATMSMNYPQYEYVILDDGITPPEMSFVPDFKNDPYALAPFRLLKSTTQLSIDSLSVYATPFPESIERILGKEYEVVEHLDGSILYKFRKKE